MKIVQVVRYVPGSPLIAGNAELGEGSVVLADDGNLWRWGYELAADRNLWIKVALPPLPDPVPVAANTRGLSRQGRR